MAVAVIVFRTVFVVIDIRIKQNKITYLNSLYIALWPRSK